MDALKALVTSLGAAIEAKGSASHADLGHLEGGFQATEADLRLSLTEVREDMAEAIDTLREDLRTELSAAQLAWQGEVAVLRDSWAQWQGLNAGAVAVSASSGDPLERPSFRHRLSSDLQEFYSPDRNQT